MIQIKQELILSANKHCFSAGVSNEQYVYSDNYIHGFYLAYWKYCIKNILSSIQLIPGILIMYTFFSTGNGKKKHKIRQDFFVFHEDRRNSQI